MVNSIDLERRKNIKTQSTSILKTKRFSKFMQKLMKRYAKGDSNISFPIFSSRAFKYAVLEKFNSYDLECGATISESGRKMIFFTRRSYL